MNIIVYVAQYPNVRGVSRVQPNVQKSASLSGVVYRNIIVYVPQYPNVSGVGYRNIILYVPQYPNVSGVQPIYRRVHL